MDKIQPNQKGFGAVEIVLAVVIVAALGFLTWYVFHAKHAADKNLGTAGSSQTTGGKSAAAASGNGTDNQNIQNDLNGIDSANSQTTKDLNASNNGLNDTSTFTSVPQ